MDDLHFNDIKAHNWEKQEITFKKNFPNRVSSEKIKMKKTKI